MGRSFSSLLRESLTGYEWLWIHLDFLWNKIQDGLLNKIISQKIEQQHEHIHYLSKALSPFLPELEISRGFDLKGSLLQQGHRRSFAVSALGRVDQFRLHFSNKTSVSIAEIKMMFDRMKVAYHLPYYLSHGNINGEQFLYCDH